MHLPWDVDVRNPAFWSPQLEREEESRRRLRERHATESLTWADVYWALQRNCCKTLVICSFVAASGAAWCGIRAGIAVVTLAPQTYHCGEELCTAYDVYELHVGQPILILKKTREERHRRGEPSGSGAW